MNRKLYCSPELWARRGAAAARDAQIDPVKFLAGMKSQNHCLVRWTLWKEMAAAGYSYCSLGTASGFDHTSVRHACVAERSPRLGPEIKRPPKPPRRVYAGGRPLFPVIIAPIMVPVSEAKKMAGRA